MAAKGKKLKIEKVGPKEWKFEDPPGLAGVSDDFERALDLMEEGNADEAEKVFRKVIRNCPLHIDARHHLALLLSDRGEAMEAFKLWCEAVAIGMKGLESGFAMGEDRLEWGWLENRPFLRAYHGLGMCFLDAGMVERAHVVFNQMLSMNPNDNQGVRALAVESGFAMDRPDEALRICGDYKDDALPDTLYGRALALLQLGETAQAEKALMQAVGFFPEVARELLKKRHRVPKDMSINYVTVGGADEAYDYWQRMGKYWKDTHGALELLADVLSRCEAKAPRARH